MVELPPDGRALDQVVRPTRPPLGPTLIIYRHILLPSRVEQRILDALTQLYDAYVYNPTISRLQDHNSIDPQIQTNLDTVYHWIMTLSEKYHIWYRAMANIKTKYLQRNMDQIFANTALVEEIAEEGRSREDADSINQDSDALGVTAVSEKTLAGLRVYMRKQKLLGLARQRTRFRREHTV